MSWLRERLHVFVIGREVAFFRAILRSRYLMRVARRFPRLAKLPPGRLIVHHADAVDALEHGRRFGMPYLAKMEELGGAFVLGPRRRGRARAPARRGPGRDRRLRLRRAARREPRLRRAAARRPQPDRRRRRAHRSRPGRDDRPPPRARRAGDRRQLVDGRTVFRDIFINGLKDPRVSRRAREAAGRLRAHVDSGRRRAPRRAAARRRHPRPADRRRRARPRRADQPRHRPARRVVGVRLARDGVRGRRAVQAAGRLRARADRRARGDRDRDGRTC